MVQKFMDECLFSKKSSLNDRIPRNKHLNFANQELQNTDKLIAKEKANDMEQLSIFTVVELVQISGSFELEDVLQHRLTKEGLLICE